MTAHLDTALLVGALIVLVAVTAVRLSVRLGLPSLLVYLGIGLAVGETGPGQSFTDVELARSLGLTALIFILAEGGLTARWRDVRPIVGLAAVLATVGVVVTIAVVALAASVALDLDLRTCSALRRGRRVDGRRRGLLHLALDRASAPPVRDAGG